MRLNVNHLRNQTQPIIKQPASAQPHTGTVNNAHQRIATRKVLGDITHQCNSAPPHPTQPQVQTRIHQQEVHPDLLRTHGGDIHKPRPEGYERFALQNVRGITRWPLPAGEVITAMDENDIAVFGVTEPNCAMDDRITPAVDACLKRNFGRGYTSAASTPGESGGTSGYLPGGVMQLIRGNVAGRHHSMGRDPLGKFTWVTMRGKNDNLLCVITAYRVCQKKGTKPAKEDCNTSHWQLA